MGRPASTLLPQWPRWKMVVAWAWVVAAEAVAGGGSGSAVKMKLEGLLGTSHIPGR